VLDQLFRSELQNDDEGHSSPRARQINGRAQHFAGNGYSAFNRVLAAIGQEELGNPRQSPAGFRGQPNESWSEVRPIVIEVSVEDRRHEE